MADNLSDDAIKRAVLAARKPSNLVTEADIEQPSIAETLYDIGAAIPSAVSRYVSSVPERFSAATERVKQMSPSEIASTIGSTAKSMIVDPAVQAFTAPGRAYRGEISQEQMLPEALNFTGMTTLGGIPASALERSGGMMLGTSGTRMLPEAAAVELAKRQLSPVGLYSHGAEAAMALPQSTGSVDQMIAMLRKQSGVTEAELKNAGLLTEEGRVNPDWLAKGKIGREDIASHLQSRMPQVEETVLKNKYDYPYTTDDEWNSAIQAATDSGNYSEAMRLRRAWNESEGLGKKGSPKYASYTLPDGKNYREVLLRVPDKTTTHYLAQNKYGASGGPFNTQEEALSFAGEGGQVLPQIKNEGYNKKLFKSSHWDEPNILAHIRMADRTGPNGEKILHIEEVQSDWGQKGKKEGFANANDEKEYYNFINDMRERVRNQSFTETVNAGLDPERAKNLIDKIMSTMKPHELATYLGENEKLHDMFAKYTKSIKGLPSAPYVTSTSGWTDLALKRVLKEAAEGGYDKVVWTPGAEQVKRYDLSKSLSKIAYNPDTGYFQALDLNGNPAINQKIETSKLPDLVGKETAEKLLSQKPNNLGVHQLETSDLTIGGEGMKEYYDKILPKRLQEIVKRHDKNAKIGSHNVWDKYDVVDAEGKIIFTHTNPEYAQNDAHFLGIVNDVSVKKSPMEMLGIDITPQMRESILKGQGAFMKGGRVGFAEGGDSLVDRSKLPGATIKPYEPTWKDRIANLLLGGEMPSAERERFVEGLVGSRGMGSTGVSVSDFVPLVGQVLPTQEALKQGDYKTAAMTSLPMGGALGSTIKNAENAAIRKLLYETAQHGPFFRVTPTKIQEGERLAGEAGQAIWPDTPADVRRIAESRGHPAYGTTKYESATGKETLIMPPEEENIPLQVANQYVASLGLSPVKQTEMPRSSLAKQGAIGRVYTTAVEGSPEYKTAVFDAYSRMMPEVIEQSGAKNYDELLAAAYRQMAKETSDQFDALPLNYSFHRAGEGDYANSGQMVADVHGNKHLFVYQGGDKHDFLHNVDPQTGLNENEKFRAVHDAFGHALLGNTFGPQGEERAWGVHSQMYSPLARLAMTSETRGQNSWVNYTPANVEVWEKLHQIDSRMADLRRRGDHAAMDELKQARKDIMSEWTYAPNKAVLMPPEFLSTEYTGEMPNYIQSLMRPDPSTTFASPATHYSFDPSLQITDPARYGTNKKVLGQERGRLESDIKPRTYFYLGEPGAVTPEPNVGTSRYRAEIGNLYNQAEDPIKLARMTRILNTNSPLGTFNPGVTETATAANDLDRLLKMYGYSGLADTSSGYPTAYVFNPVPVQRYADGGRAEYASKGAVKEDDEIRSALDIARQIEDPANRIEADIRALTQNLSGLDIASAFPAFSTGLPQRPQVGGAGLIPSRPANIPEQITVLRPTVDNPQRMAYPLIYENPKTIAAKAAANVAPEDEALKRLFGVTRDDLYQMSKGRMGTAVPDINLGKGKTPEPVESIMNQRNAQRLIDTLAEAEKYPHLTRGMDAWYTSDPMYQRLVQLVGKEAADRRFSQINTRTGMMSPGSDVDTEINRGFAADYMISQGRFPEFQKFGGMSLEGRPKDFPKEIERVLGHPYHSTSHVGPLSKYIQSGEVDMTSPKVPLYIQSSNVPELGQQTRWPVPDAHFTRASALADTRTASDFKPSMKMSEYRPFGEWYYQNVAQPLGLEGVPAQGRQWGTFAHATGVKTPIGAPKLELIAKHMMDAARYHDIEPEVMRDLILMGEKYERGGRTMGNNAIDNAIRVARLSDDKIDMPKSLKELQNWKKTHPSKGSMDKAFSARAFGFEGAPSVAMPANIDELLAYLRGQRASGGRAAFGFGGDSDAAEGSSYTENIRNDYTPSFREAETQSMNDLERAYNTGEISRPTERDSTYIGQTNRGLPEDYTPAVDVGPYSFGNTGVTYDAGTSNPPTNIREYTRQRLETTPDDLYQAASNPSLYYGMGYPSTVGIQPTRAGAAGLLGTLYGESEYDPTAINSESGAVGMAQYLGSRKEDFLRAMGIDTRRPTDAELKDKLADTQTRQMGYIINEMLKEPSYELSEKQYLTGTNPEKVAGVITKNFERPSEQEIIDSAARRAAEALSIYSGEPPTLSDTFTGSPAANATGKSGFNAPAEGTIAQAKAAATQPSVLDKLFGTNEDRIAGLEANNRYYGGDRDAVAAALGVDPDQLKARIVMDRGQQAVDYYTKDLSDVLKEATSDLFGRTPSTNYNLTRDVNYNAPTGYGPYGDMTREEYREMYGGKDSSAINAALQAAQTTTAQPAAATAPYLTELSKSNLALPNTEGMTAQQWADTYAGGDLSKVHARIVYRQGAPRLEYYMV